MKIEKIEKVDYVVEVSQDQLDLIYVLLAEIGSAVYDGGLYESLAQFNSGSWCVTDDRFLSGPLKVERVVE